MNNRGTSLVGLLVAITMAAAVMYLSGQLMRSTAGNDRKLVHQSFVSSLHSSRIQAARHAGVITFLKNKVATTSALSDCLSEAGGANCTTFAADTPLDVNIPIAGGNFVLNSDEKFGERGPCVPDDCIAEQTTNYKFNCDDHHCTAARIHIDTKYLGNVSTIQLIRKADVEISKFTLASNQLYGWGCVDPTGNVGPTSPNSYVITGVEVSHAVADCQQLPNNACGGVSPPSLMRLFASSATNFCQQAPVIPPAAGNQGYTAVHVWGTEVSTENYAYPTPVDYCMGEAKRSKVIGSAADDTRGITNWFNPVVAGKPYPCTIQNHYHLNLNGHASATVKNECPDHYTSKFETMHGTDEFSCSHSDKSVSCTNTGDGPADMDTIDFLCNWDN